MNSLERLYRQGRYAEGRRLQIAIGVARGGSLESGGAISVSSSHEAGVVALSGAGPLSPTTTRRVAQTGGHASALATRLAAAGARSKPGSGAGP